MQVSKKQIQRQQVILTHLGFYRHKCDGIWGPESIAAKRKFEADVSFVPALPNNGLPFGEREKYPKGMRMGSDRMLTYTDPKGKKENDLTQEKIKQIAGDLLFMNKVTDASKVEETPVVVPKEPDAPVVTNKEVLAPVAVNTEKKEQDKQDDKKPEQGNQNKGNNPQNNQNQNKGNQNNNQNQKK